MKGYLTWHVTQTGCCEMLVHRYRKKIQHVYNLIDIVASNTTRARCTRYDLIVTCCRMVIFSSRISFPLSIHWHHIINDTDNVCSVNGLITGMVRFTNVWGVVIILCICMFNVPEWKRLWGQRTDESLSLIGTLRWILGWRILGSLSYGLKCF